MNIGGVSAGLRLDAAATLTCREGSMIQLNFTQAPAAGGLDGLCWGGEDKADDLQALIDAGRLDWDDAAAGGRVVLYTGDGETCIGIPPPRGTVIQLR